MHRLAPLLLAVCAGCVTFNPGLYSHGFATPLPPPQKQGEPAPPVPAANPVPKNAETVLAGRELYETYCAECHGVQGKGDGETATELGVHPANLTKVAGKKTDGQLWAQIAYGKADMPSWREVLSDEDLWFLVNYIQSLGLATKE